MEAISYIEGVQEHILSALKSKDVIKMGGVSTKWNPLSRARIKEILKTRIFKTFCKDWERYDKYRAILLPHEVDPTVRKLLRTEPHERTIRQILQKLNEAIKIEEFDFNVKNERSKLQGQAEVSRWEQQRHVQRQSVFITSLNLLRLRLNLETQRDKISDLVIFCLPDKPYLVYKFRNAIHSQRVFDLLVLIQNSL